MPKQDKDKPAMKKCSECDKMMPMDAKKCPECGHEMSMKGMKPEMKKKMSAASEVYLSRAPLELAEGETKSSVEILRTGRWDGMKGKFEITEQNLQNFADSFKQKTYGTDLQVNIAHNRWGEAAGWFKDVSVKGDKLMAEIEWTSHGLKLLKDKIFRFFSSEIAFVYQDEETLETFRDVLMGGALTNIPYIRGLAPVMFSEEVESFIHNEFAMKEHKKLDDAEETKPTEGEATTEADETTDAEEATEAEKVEADDKGTKMFSAAQVQDMIKAATAGVQSDLQKMQTDLKRKDFTERLKGFELSDNGEVSCGFSKDFLSKDVLEFAMTLSEKQATIFFSILGAVKAVDFAEHGFNAEGEANVDKTQFANSEYPVSQESLELDARAKDYAAKNKVSYEEALLAVAK